MAPISARTAVLAKWAVIPAALIVSGVVVSQASYSAFSATTTDPGVNWKAGTVQLANGSTATAKFEAENLKPNQSGSRCITVTSTGSLASTVKLYGMGYTTSSVTRPTPALPLNFSSYVNLVITQGSGGSADCTGFTEDTTVTAVSTTLQQLGTEVTDYGKGISSWTTAGTTTAPETRTYRIAYTLDNGTPNTMQAGNASIGFTWEAVNN